MPGQINVKQVDVALSYANGGWLLDYDGNSYNGHTKPYPAIGVGKDKGPHFIVFKIQNTPNVTFSNDPIWVSAAGKPGPQATDPQIGGWQIKDNGKTLVVFDWNSKKVDLDYQLNFTGANPLDPIIQNGGGGGGQPGFDIAWAQVAITGAVFLAIGVLLQKKFKFI